MATQTTKTTHSRISAATRTGDDPDVRSSKDHHGRSGYLVPYLTPADFFRMNPFALMRRMSEELDRAFGESNGREHARRTWTPAVEVMQREGNYRGPRRTSGTQAGRGEAGNYG